MRLRRSFALLAGSTLLATGLSSCGFDKATNRPYTPGEGTLGSAETMKVQSAVIVAAQPDSGTFIATMVNGDRREPVAFEALVSEGEEAVEVAEFDAVEIAPQGFVNLATEGGVAVEGTFEVGQFLPLEVTFANGESVSLDVPVVRACEAYEGLDVTATGAGAATEEAAESESEESGAEESAEGEEGEGLPDAYSCDYAEGLGVHSE